VRELIYKKGFAKIDKKKVPLTDNNLIEQVVDNVLLNIGHNLQVNFFLNIFIKYTFIIFTRLLSGRKWGSMILYA